MESTIDANVPVFKICGFSIPLAGVNLPNIVTIKHPTSEIHKGITRIEDRDACDVIIRIGEKTIRAHKDLLISAIPFFRDLFNANMVECTNGEINLSSKFCEFDLSTMERLLDYAYTGCLSISTDTVQDLMMGASFLRIESVMDACSDFMKRRLTIENIFALLSFCRSIAYERIISDMLKFIDAKRGQFQKNFVYLFRTAEFLDLSIDDLITFLKRDSLYVFESVARWVDFDINRRQYAMRLLAHVRCSLLSDDFITDTVEKTTWVTNSPECIALVDRAKVERLMSNHISKRNCDDRHVLFFAYRPVDNCPHDKFSFQIYDPITNFWTSLKNNRPSNRLFDGALSDKHTIFFRRALNNETPEPGPEWLEVYNTLTDEWFTERKEIERNISKFPEYMHHVLYGAIINWIDEKVYVAGGSTNDGWQHAVDSLETYDEISKEWKPLAPMRMTRKYACAEVVNGKLYVFGGISFEMERLNDGECYDPKTDKWHPISPMQYNKSSFASVAYNNKIYVFGGRTFGDKILDAVERYDPVTNTWSTMKNMISKRHVFNMASAAHASTGVSCGKLFVFGGLDNWYPETRINTVEMYDPETDTWELRRPMEHNSVCIPLSIPSSYPSPIANFESTGISEFRDFHLKEELLQAIAECGFMYPTKVQSECIPQAIKGEDVISESDSRGKSSSYVISTLQQLKPIDGQVSAIVLAPSRNKAPRIKDEYERLSKYLGPIKTVSFFGGIPIKQHERFLENNCPHIVVGTPFRVLNLIHSGKLNIGNIKHLVLDECCRMLGDSDTLNVITKIFKSTAGQTQILSYGVYNNKTKQKLQDIYRQLPLKNQ